MVDGKPNRIFDELFSGVKRRHGVSNLPVLLTLFSTA
jgi:hypothetical protein